LRLPVKTLLVAPGVVQTDGQPVGHHHVHRAAQEARVRISSAVIDDTVVKTLRAAGNALLDGAWRRR
jgi:hypothetical protein